MKSEGQLSKEKRKVALVRKTDVYTGPGAAASMKESEGDWSTEGEEEWYVIKLQ